MSENEDSTMSDESDAETSKSHQKEDIFGKYTDKDYGILDGSDTGCTDEDDEDQRYSRKKSKFDPWTFFVDGAHSILQDTFNEGVQHIIEKNPDIDTEEAEEVISINWNQDTEQKPLVNTRPSLNYPRH